MPKVVGNAGYVSTIRDGYTCVAVSELVRVESGESVFFSKFGKIMFWRRRMHRRLGVVLVIDVWAVGAGKHICMIML